MERMKSLGIADLSNQLKCRPTPSLRKPSKPKPSRSSNDPLRRSSRLKELPPVSYSEKRSPKKDRSSSNSDVEIHIPEGENPEIYTNEHELLLGNSVAPWTLYVDEYDEDGQRVYDPHLGKSCHQCRQKISDYVPSAASAAQAQGSFVEIAYT